MDQINRGVLVAVALAMVATSAHGQSGTTIPPDSESVLVSKDVGVERWAISRDLDSKTVTGNVFKTDGSPPQFVWCDQVGKTAGNLSLECYGTDACGIEGCADTWGHIATVSLPFLFVAAGDRGAQTPGLEGLLGDWRFLPRIIGIAFRQTYALDRIETTSGGIRGILGTDVGDDLVGVFRVQDLKPGSSLPQEFSMLDPSTILCRFFLFDRKGDLVDGLYYQLDSDGSETPGGCDTDDPGDAYDLEGVKLASHALAASASGPRLSGAQERTEAAAAKAATEAGLGAAVAARANDLRALIEATKAAAR